MIEIFGELGTIHEAAREAAARADLVVATTTTLDALAVPDDRRLPMGRVIPAIHDLHERLDDRHAGRLDLPAEEGGPRVVVIAQGDPGFFGAVRRFRADGLTPRVHVAPTSVAAAFAAVALPWDDAHVVTTHGQPLAFALAAARALPKVAVLTAPHAGVRELAEGLADLERWYVVGERLGMTDERIRVLDGPAARELEEDPRMPNVVLVLAAPPDSRGALGQPTAYAGGPRLDPAETAEHPEKPGPGVLPSSAPAGPHAAALSVVLGRHLPVLGEHVWAAPGVAGELAAAVRRTGAAVVDLGSFLSFGSAVPGVATALGEVTGELPDALPDPDLVVLDDPRLLASVVARHPRVVTLVFGDESAGLAAGSIDAVVGYGGYAADVTLEHVAITEVDGDTRVGYLATLTRQWRDEAQETA